MIDALRPYPKYKESYVPWLGEVPEHWEVRKLKFLARLKSGDNITSYEIEETGDFPVYGGGGLRGYTSKFNHDGEYVLLGRQGALCGNVTYAKGKFWASEHAVVAHLHREFPTVWFGELLRSMNLNQYSQSAAQPGLAVERIQNLIAPIPPVDECTTIVRFLEVADRRIQKYIRAKQRLIALLNEQKQAIIQRAVTQGLNPDAPKKPSGIPWLGDIPAHWEVRRLKYVGETQIGLIYSPADLTDETGTLVLRASNIHEGKLVSADNVFVRCRISEKVRVKKDDILICARSGSRNLVGKSALIPANFEGVAFGAFMSVFRSSWNDFVFWVLNSNLLTSVMAEFETSTINQLTQGDLNNLRVPIPPRHEQTAIVAFVKEKTASMDDAISRPEREIDLLREYRTRLVADVVTGKLDVRAAASRLPKVSGDTGNHSLSESESEDALDLYDSVESEEVAL